MKKIFKYSVKGSSIIEVLIAMAILAFCSALATVIYLNIQKSSLPFFKIKAVELAELYIKNATDSKELTDGSFKVEEFTVNRTISMCGNYPDCINVKVLVFDGNKKKIHELEQVIYKGK